jgi:hypothetical protein
MFTNIVAVGLIDNPIKSNVRLLKVERPARDSEGIFVTDEIPVTYWSRATNNYFMGMKNGTLILVKGRIEHDADHGLTIVTDHLETLLPVKDKQDE